MAQFEYTKDMIYAEFKEATAKDEKSKKPSYKHRVAMLKRRNHKKTQNILLMKMARKKKLENLKKKK